MKRRISINLITSKVFWESMPIIIAEIVKREHYLSIFDDKHMPALDGLFDCDVLIDMSAITDVDFYEKLQTEYARRKKFHQNVPLMVDSPDAVMNSMDKRKTHALMPDLVPESYNLDGVNNESIIAKFSDDEYLLIKDPFGWQARGIDRLSPRAALEKYRVSKGLIVQKYIPFTDGVGRVLTLNYTSDFEIICAYLRIPDSWRTGEGTESQYKLVEIDEKLRDFAKGAAIRSGLYLNGIDYLYKDGAYVLLEVNAAPGLRDPYDEFEIDTPKIFLDHIERNTRLVSGD